MLNKEEIVKETVKEEAVKEDAVQGETVKEDAVKEETVKEETVKEETVKEEIVKEETTIKNDTKTETIQTVGTNAAQETSKITEAIQTNMVAAETPKAKDTGYRSEMNGIEVDFELQYRDQETDMKDIAKRVTEDYVRRGNDASGIKLIQVYLKPTDFTAYYVINNSYEGKIPLFS